MFTRERILQSSRWAGSVERYHTWPKHQRQTVADHSYHCLRIYRELFGPIPPEVSTYFIWHDAGELVLGDLPFPVKSRNPALKAICDEVEVNAVLDMGGYIEELPEPLKLKSKICDYIEMLEFGITEAKLGNEMARPIIEDINTNLTKLVQSLPQVEREAVHKYVWFSTQKLGEARGCM